jgi:hypothetical protein
MKEAIENIVQKEYAMLDKVNNTGGRAWCQDDFDAFRLMRASQFLVWPDQILESYLDDLKDAERIGRNLLFEKYAWMMMFALPEEFEKVEHVLPVFSVDKICRMEEIIALQAAWAEEFANRYPFIGGQGRPVYSSQDTPDDISVETYMRGELSTYSDKTEILYHDFVLCCKAEGRNLTTEARRNQLHFQGWESLEQAERRYAARKTKR